MMIIVKSLLMKKSIDGRMSSSQKSHELFPYINVRFALIDIYLYKHQININQRKLMGHCFNFGLHIKCTKLPANYCVRLNVERASRREQQSRRASAREREIERKLRDYSISTQWIIKSNVNAHYLTPSNKIQLK